MRNIFRKKLMIEANKLDLIDYVESEILELEDTIACHLYEVKNVNIDSSDDELNSIADVNNGLLLSSTLHDIFDKYKITFETSGRLKSNSEIYKKKYKGLKIAEKALNKKRQMYIQKRNEVTNLK